jgi:hypothetical protein
MGKKESKNKRNVNWRVVIYSILALLCLGLVFAISWLFLIPVAVLIWMNQRELFPKK